jgi:hypothetical protein
MTEDTIIEDLARWLDSRKYPYQIPRAFIYGWESDFWCMTNSGETREFEIKISRSDYAADKKKEKHSDTTKGANYFYYVCPKGVIAKEDVDSKYGLIYVFDRSLEVVKKPKKLNDFVFKDWRMLANKMYWKWYSLWWSKYKAKEISVDEYRAGFNLSLESVENTE